jgi:hypothetical protein
VDLVAACEKERLLPETSALVFGQCTGVPRSITIEDFEMSKEEVAGARREMRHAIPALQGRLAAYQLKKTFPR